MSATGVQLIESPKAIIRLQAPPMKKRLKKVHSKVKTGCATCRYVRGRRLEPELTRNLADSGASNVVNSGLAACNVPKAAENVQDIRSPRSGFLNLSNTSTSTVRSSCHVLVDLRPHLPSKMRKVVALFSTTLRCLNLPSLDSLPQP